MRLLPCCILLVFPLVAGDLRAAVLSVGPGQSIQAAIDRAAAGDTIIVSAGTYAGNLVIAKRLALLGGGDGSGDPAARDPRSHLTTIQATPTAPSIAIRNAQSSDTIIDGFTITGGNCGIHAAAWDQPDRLTISHNIIENNGAIATNDSVRGGGIYLYSSSGHLICDNVIRANFAGWGGGLYCATNETRVLRNHIVGNRAYADHGAAMYLVGSPFEFEDNIVEYNTVSASPTIKGGSGGGIFFNGPNTVAYVRRCISRFNHANAYGAGLDSDSGATIYADHVLIYGNTAQSAPGVYISAGDPQAGAITLSFCTIAGNRSTFPNAGNAIDARGGVATATNCLIADSAGCAFWLFPERVGYPGGILNLSYSCTDVALAGPGNFVADPLFADPTSGDFHLRSAFGRWSPTTSSWLLDAVTSPALDTADPAADFALEPAPNGGRANLGFYGATAEASRSALPSITTYAAWRAANFTGPDLAADAVSGPLADPDAAGVTNLQRYAHHLPARGTAGAPITLGTAATADEKFLTLSFVRHTDATDLTYVVETSGDLAIWDVLATYAPGTASASTVTEQDNVPLRSTTRRFLRLRLSLP